MNIQDEFALISPPEEVSTAPNSPQKILNPKSEVENLKEDTLLLSGKRSCSSEEDISEPLTKEKKYNDY